MASLLFSGLQVGEMFLKNRIIMPAINHCYSPDGFCGKQIKDYYQRRAKGGVGMIVVGGCFIDKAGAGSKMIDISSDAFNDDLSKLTFAINDEDAAAVAQLFHGGYYANPAKTGLQNIGPSAVYSSFSKTTPKEMDETDMDTVVKAYAAAALRARKCGFDAVEILGSAGYLIAEFLSPYTNKRQDEYGGKTEGRVRFLLRVISAIKAAAGASLPIIVRISGNDFMAGGNSSAEAVMIARLLAENGVAAISVTGGWHESRVPQLPWQLPPGGYHYLAQQVRGAVDIPVFAANRINTPELAEHLLAIGAADAICMGRPLIADPDFPHKAQYKQEALIRPCIACGQSCTDKVFSGQEVGCALNPQAGQEYQTTEKIRKVRFAKKVLVIGGGITGAHAAIAAAQRGHKVTLWEKEEHLGGHLYYAGKMGMNAEFLKLLAYLETMLSLQGVDVCLGKKATVKNVQEIPVDTVILSSGSKLASCPLNTSEFSGNTGDALAVWNGQCLPRQNVIIIGGGSLGCLTALLLARQSSLSPEQLRFLLMFEAESTETVARLAVQCSRNIIIVEQGKKLGRGIGAGTRWPILQELSRYGVEFCSESTVIAATKKTVTIQKADGAIFEKTADTLLWATGFVPNRELYMGLANAGKKIILIGDADRPAGIAHGVVQALEAVGSI
ncbi:MAG: FAD-dependent oxidoreductase [Clostridiales bacterium]|nr:FAD-dependent oxidoreductase [Clostridiales bacterium]